MALADLVRVIRTFRPDVLVPRFSGTDRDGHGNHQASSILAKEAFRAAADPKRFPEQIAEGLQPWQAKKLYIGNVCGFGAMTCPDRGMDFEVEYRGKRARNWAWDMFSSRWRGCATRSHRERRIGRSIRETALPFISLIDSVLPVDTGQGWTRKDFF